MAGDTFTFQDATPFTMAGRSAVAGRIRSDGLRFRNDAGRFLPLGVSGFSLPSKVILDYGEAVNFLDWAAGQGFNTVRVFAGDLGWANQTPDLAIQGLPLLMSLTRERGLYLVVTGLTGTSLGYPVEPHMQQVASMCGLSDHTYIEIANEPFHPTQSEKVHDFGYLSYLGRAYADPFRVDWACGAPQDDEAHIEMDGQSVWFHLDRGRDLWNMVRRVRELAADAEWYRRPVWNGEPIGWDETGEAGRRCDRPEIAFTMGVLSRGFGVGLISHAQHGLRAEMPGPVQLACHQEVIRGFHAFGTDADLTFKNAGWDDSPIAGANFDVVTRVYSFLDTPRHGWTVLVGIKGDPQLRFKNGFGLAADVAEAGDAAHGVTRIVEIGA